MMIFGFPYISWEHQIFKIIVSILHKEGVIMGVGTQEFWRSSALRPRYKKDQISLFDIISCFMKCPEQKHKGIGTD